MDTTSKRSRFQTNSPRMMPSTRNTIHWSDSIKSLLHFDVRVDNIYKPDGQICRPYRQASETREGSRTGSKPACNLLKDSAGLNPGRPQGRGLLSQFPQQYPKDPLIIKAVDCSATLPEQRPWSRSDRLSGCQRIPVRIQPACLSKNTGRPPL